MTTMPKRKFRRENVLLALTVSSVVLGVALGFGCRSFEPSEEAIQLINFPGEIFLQLLKMLLLPLIVASLISALAQLDAKESTKMGLLTLFYYFMTTTLAAVVSNSTRFIRPLEVTLRFKVGMVLVHFIHPGDPRLNKNIPDEQNTTRLSPIDTYLDLIRNMFPENLVRATFEHQRTIFQPVRMQLRLKQENNSEESVLKKSVEYQDGLNILAFIALAGIIVFCTAFGIICSQLGNQARVMIDFFIVLDTIIMRMVSVVMWCAPLGICCLICASILALDDLSNTAQMLAMYIVTVLCGLFIHCFLTVPIIFVIVTRRNPFLFAKGTMQAVLTAFGTSSSGAALPASFRCAEENNHIDKRVSRFVLPLGSNINMDGPALYEAVAIIFIAQLNGVDLSFAELVTVALTTTLASLGTGSIPAGLLPILVVLPTIGLPINNISFIVTVDWLLDRIRTALNVLSDAFATAIIESLTKSKLLRKSIDNDEFTNKQEHEEAGQQNGLHGGHQAEEITKF